MKNQVKKALWTLLAVTIAQCPSPINYPLKSASAAAETIGPGWQLVRTPGPKEGRHVVSIMHTADALRSDPDFAGLMIRCRDKALLQIGFVLVQPLPPRENPDVTITAAGETARFKGTMLPTGAILSLPDTAAILPEGSWQNANEIRVSIQSKGAVIRGVVTTDHLEAALKALRSSCDAR